MYVAETQVRVRYAETDQMGYAYYGNYATYYEVGRVEALRQLGFQYKEMEENGIMMPVTDLKCKFLKPARYDELITIRVIIKALPSVRMYFYYEVLDADGNKLNEGETTLVFINMSSNRPCKAPEYLLKKLSPYFE
ncbi:MULTISPECIES: acyl-CoA thioesterase [Roseivirga]|jgi:acyl-CoA thioester hydrolase|uniref:acyl-CoA thioesterase n=1 Tax=Roseivirga TaxID=290180 RepID=UPI001B1C3C8E|nr:MULTISPECIES: thioesterase family protein [Roseivirga]MBO6497596.1 acyl-CoA thioesterase [Roseivirga sp.]WPZ11013.1 thioesterase family protein [Roseivirga spongicola]